MPTPQPLHSSLDVLFLLLGSVMILAMDAGFAFLELGTVRAKNQVNALGKILADFCVSTIAYYFIGYPLAYGIHFFHSTDVLLNENGYELMKFFFLLTFAAAIPAIVSGGVAERARLKLDDVLGVWPLHGVCGLWGGIAAGIFGQAWLGGHGGVSFWAQVVGSLIGVVFATAVGFGVYGFIKKVMGLRLGDEEEFNGADLSIHKISSTFDKDMF